MDAVSPLWFAFWTWIGCNIGLPGSLLIGLWWKDHRRERRDGLEVLTRGEGR